MPPTHPAGQLQQTTVTSTLTQLEHQAADLTIFGKVE